MSICGLETAIAIKKEVASQYYELLYHGTNAIDDEDVELVKKNGLPARGTNRDLLQHIEPNGVYAPSAFRGSSALLGKATQWATGSNPVVFYITGFRGYDVMEHLGQEIETPGGFRDPVMKECEIVIPAEVPLKYLLRYATVTHGWKRPQYDFYEFKSQQ